MSIDNRCGWREWFAVSNFRLMATMGNISENSVIRAKKELLEAGLIQFKKGKKGSPSQYHMNHIDLKICSKSGDMGAGGAPPPPPPEEPPAGPEDVDLSDYLQDINDYFGVTEALKREVTSFTDRLFTKYAGRQPSQQDIVFMFHHIRGTETGPDGKTKCIFPEEKKRLAEYAFQQATAGGNVTWRYINGIYRNFFVRGIKTVDDAEEYDAKRDMNAI
jgi:hypothetical protein